MSSDASDTLKIDESEAVEQSTEEKFEEDAAKSEGEAIEEEEDDDDDDDYRSSISKKNLIVGSGKREKKKVERLSLEMTVARKEPVITEGKGQKLQDIERIFFFLKKKKCEELRLLHRLLFNRLGTASLVKKNIGMFSGFPFEQGSDLYKKKEEMIKRFKKSDLKNICGILDLEKSGVNSELISKIMNFLMDPKSTGKSLPKSKSPRGGKERSSSGSARKSKSRRSNVILTDESSSEDEKKEKEESSEEEKESEEEEEEEEPPKKVAKKEKAKTKSTPKRKRATKSSNVKRADSSTTNKSPGSSKKEKVVESESESDDSSDDEPLIKKLKKPPTDEEIRETVQKLLAEANLEDVTMRQLCKKVNESYPNHDLSSRKKFIKATAKELIS